MADTPPTSAGGLSSDDFRARATPVMLRRNGNSTEQNDPLKAGIAMRREIAGLKMIERAAAEEDIATAQARNEKLKLEIEARRLEADRAGTAQGGQGDKWLEAAFEEIRVARQQIADANERMAAQQVTLLQERIGMLTDEFQRVQAAAASAPPPVDALDQTVATLEKHKRLSELIAPPTVEKPPAGAGDAVVMAYIERLHIDQQRWEKQESNRSAERMRQIDMETQIAMRRLELDQANQQVMTRFVDTTLPTLGKMFEPLVEQWANRLANGVTPGVAGASSAPVGASGATVRPQVAASVPLPPGAVEMACQACGQRIVYRSEWPGVICPNCHAEYQNTPAASGPPSAAAATVETRAETGADARVAPDTWLNGSDTDDEIEGEIVG